MTNLLFISLLAMLLGSLYAWGFRHLSKERWQFIGTIPIFKTESGQWHGLNLTYYGLFNATACTLAVVVVYVLLASAGYKLATINWIMVATLAPCMPAAKLVARWVEKKPHTFSIGGAAFVGLIATPWLLLLLRTVFRWFGAEPFSIAPPLAAIAIAYSLGEGSGRLACISFGCCYGKPIEDLPPLLGRLLSPLSVVFHGDTKKISYASDFGNKKVVAIQAITTVLYTTAGLAATGLFLQGHLSAALLLSVTVTQLWRFLSEFLRADYRGAGRISAYQLMALIAIVYTAGVTAVLPATPVSVDLLHGMHLLWRPFTIITCQLFWVGIFLYLGRSQVTGARITFHVHQDRI